MAINYRGFSFFPSEKKYTVHIFTFCLHAAPEHTLFRKKFSVYLQILLLKHIKYHAPQFLIGPQEILHRADGNFGGPSVGKTEFSGGNTAECNTFTAVFHGQLKTGAVTGSQ